MSALVFFFGGLYCSKYHTGGVERHCWRSKAIGVGVGKFTTDSDEGYSDKVFCWVLEPSAFVWLLWIYE